MFASLPYGVTGCYAVCVIMVFPAQTHLFLSCLVYGNRNRLDLSCYLLSDNTLSVSSLFLSVNSCSELFHNNYYHSRSILSSICRISTVNNIISISWCVFQRCFRTFIVCVCLDSRPFLFT